MKKRVFGLILCLLCVLSFNLNAGAYAGDDYLKIIERISAQSGFFEPATQESNELYNGLIYGEFIDFDFNGTEEMLLIYRDENIVKNGFAKAEIYAVVDGTLQCVFSEEITGDEMTRDIGSLRVCVNNLGGKMYFIAYAYTPSSDFVISEKIVAFTISGGYPSKYEYYCEMKDDYNFWELFDPVYTKCMIGERLVSAEEYIDVCNWLFNDGRFVFLFNLDSSVERWNSYYCTYDRLQKFMSRAYALADEAIKVTINGDRVIFDVPPQIINGRTMVPMRSIFETFGAAIDWNEETKTITAVCGDKTIIMQIGAGSIMVNGEPWAIDVPAQIIGGRTLVPARAVSVALGCGVSWDAESKTVIITSDEPFAFG